MHTLFAVVLTLNMLTSTTTTYGTPVQLLHAQTEAVAHKPTLARPSAWNSHCGIGEGRCSGCEPSSGVTSCRRALACSSYIPVLVLMLLWAWVWSCPTREPTRCSRLAKHARHPGAVAARLGSKQRPRAARAEAARAGRLWRWLASNGVTFFCVRVPSHLLSSPFYSLSLVVETQIRGHVAGSSSPYPLLVQFSCLAFLSREDFNSLFPRRLAPNCAY